MKSTWNPSKKKRKRNCGFRARNKTIGGRAILLRRRRKGRYNLTTA